MIYFCIPVHNEEKTVGVVLWKLRQVMAGFPRDYQILLADDGSTDGTPQVIEPYRRVLPLILLRCNRSRGYAAALEMLLREAARRSRYPRRDIVVTMQADFSDDAENAPVLLRKTESGADLVVGGPVSDAVRTGFAERVSARILRRLVRRREWPEPISEPLYGFAAVRLSCVRRALDAVGPDRLLGWEGLAANAALFAAVAPHARRIETVEMMRHPERRQRPRRARLMPTLREVYRFARGQRSPGLLAADRLVPDEVHGDLSALRQEREAGKAGSSRRRSEGEQERRRPRKDGDPRRTRQKADRKTAGAESGSDERRAAEGDAAGPSRRRSRDGGQRKRRGRPRGPEAAPPEVTEADGQADSPATASGAGSGGAPRKRRRRGRRGGSGRRRPARDAATGAEGPTPDEDRKPDNNGE